VPFPDGGYAWQVPFGSHEAIAAAGAALGLSAADTGTPGWAGPPPGERILRRYADLWP
jgi:hypothetical protein